MENLMENVFYFAGFIAIIYELVVATNPQKIVDFKVRATDKNASDEDKKMWSLFGTLHLAYLLWALIGLLSSQWILFLALVIMSFIPKNLLFLRRLDAILSFSILILIILNKYHSVLSLVL